MNIYIILKKKNASLSPNWKGKGNKKNPQKTGLAQPNKNVVM
jgi:hypothetical protein